MVNHPGGSYTVTWSDGINPIQTATVNCTSYTVIGLTPNTAYTVSVAAVKKCGTGPFSVFSVKTIAINYILIMSNCICDSITPTYITNVIDTTATTTVNNTKPIVFTTTTSNISNASKFCNHKNKGISTYVHS